MYVYDTQSNYLLKIAHFYFDNIIKEKRKIMKIYVTKKQ